MGLQKRRAVWRLAGDIRGEGAAILLRMWAALGWIDEDSSVTAQPRYGVRLHIILSLDESNVHPSELPGSAELTCWPCCQSLSQPP